MSIRIGIYDFFAYTIPGGFYLFTILFFCTNFGVLTVDSQWISGLALDSLTFILIGAAIVGYVLGLILDPLAVVWHRLFKARKISRVVLETFKRSHPEYEVKFEADDWPGLLAYLRHENLEVASDIDKHNATCIMLRNVGLNLSVLALLQLGLFLQFPARPVHVIVGIVLMVLSLLAGQAARKYRLWFYAAIYETIGARTAEVSDFVTRKPAFDPPKTEASASASEAPAPGRVDGDPAAEQAPAADHAPSPP